jgi:hypothetical protein
VVLAVQEDLKDLRAHKVIKVSVVLKAMKDQQVPVV